MSPDPPGAFILAVDHGTSGCKVALISVRGEVVDVDFEPTPIYFSAGGGAEQVPEDWWNALLAASGRLIERSPRSVRENVVAVCCSSTYSSTVAVDASGNALGNCLTWMDSRGAPHVRRAMRGLVNVAGYGLSNVARWLPRTGGAPTLSGKDDIAHVLVWKHDFPDIYRAAHMFMGSKDYLNLRLTGRFAASYDSMTLFWVSDSRNIANVHYDERLIARFGLDRAKLPPMVAATSILGELKPEVAKELGLGPGVVVVSGSPDLQSACVGSGAVGDFEGHVYIGTSSWLLCHVPFKKTDMFHTIASIPSSIPGKYFCANEQDVAGGCLTYLIDNLLFHANEVSDRKPPSDIYERLEAVVSRVPPGADKLIFTPWLNGEKTPADDHALRAGFYNMSMTTTIDHMVRAVYEGVALNSRWALKYVERFIKRRMDALNIIGGGARSEAWCQIFADVLDRRIRRVKDPLQANARGAAFIASVAMGYLKFEDIGGLVQIDRTFEPDPGNRALYDELFREFLVIYKNNRSMYHRLNW
ncbi:MAG: FGGY-family carbohydrate kinase [Actinomycetota bacterium]